jgi:hypothetical protein
MKTYWCGHKGIICARGPPFSTTVIQNVTRLQGSVNPLPVQFKSLLPGQEGCVFFQLAFKYMYLPLRFSTFRLAGGI